MKCNSMTIKRIFVRCKRELVVRMSLLRLVGLTTYHLHHYNTTSRTCTNRTTSGHGITRVTLTRNVTSVNNDTVGTRVLYTTYNQYCCSTRLCIVTCITNTKSAILSLAQLQEPFVTNSHFNHNSD